jgi:hypothetical protein
MDPPPPQQPATYSKKSRIQQNQQQQQQCTKPTKAYYMNAGYVCAAQGCTKLVCYNCYKEVLKRNKILTIISIAL